MQGTVNDLPIKKAEKKFISTDGKTPVSCVVFRDDTLPPAALVNVICGYGQDFEKYSEFAEFVAGNGIAVCANRSFVSDSTGERIVDDAHRLSNIIGKDSDMQSLPQFVMGISEGTFAAREYMRAFGNELTGAVLCGPTETPASLALFDKPVDTFLRITGNSGKKQPQQANYRLSQKVCSRQWYGSLKKDLGILIVSGQMDPYGLFSFAPEALCTNLEMNGLKPSFKLIEGEKKDILHSAQSQNIYFYIMSWMFSQMMK